MSSDNTDTKPGTGHALAFIAEDQNDASWLEGEYYGVASGKTFLQDLAGNGGTVWVVASYRDTDGRRRYRVALRLENCTSKTLPDASRFGRFVVQGDPGKSRLLAANDARLLLMALRFDPAKPINSATPSSISNSIRGGRRLAQQDVQLLEEFVDQAGRWSVFISYKRQDSYDSKVPEDLYTFLQDRGVNVFRDRNDIKLGSRWEQMILSAIERARCVVLLIGAQTHASDWVTREIQHAMDSGVPIMPIYLGEGTPDWATVAGADLSSYNGLAVAPGGGEELYSKILQDIPRMGKT